MGEPAEMSPSDRAEAHRIAELVIDNVVNDKLSPLNTLADEAIRLRTDMDDRLVVPIDTAILWLAQLVIRQDREIELLRAIAHRAFALQNSSSVGHSSSDVSDDEDCPCEDCAAHVDLYKTLVEVRPEIEAMR